MAHTLLKDIDDAMSYLKRPFTVRNLLWLIYLSLLGVLLPHTAWAFKHFQAKDSEWLGWLLAFTFEASVFGFTHNLVGRIEKSHRLRQKEGESWYGFAWRKFSEAYVNLNGLGLLAASAVSGLANFTYTVEFAGAFKAFGTYSIPPLVYHLAFGGILPLVSLLFAHILAKPVPIEDLPNEAETQTKAELRTAKQEVKDLRSQLYDLRQELAELRSRTVALDRLFGEDKQERILAAHELFGYASGSAIASITRTAPSYVSDVLKSQNGKTEEDVP